MYCTTIKSDVNIQVLEPLGDNSPLGKYNQNSVHHLSFKVDEAKRLELKSLLVDKIMHEKGNLMYANVDGLLFEFTFCK